MPKFFVDFQDGNAFHEDEEGSDLEGFEQARAEAVEALSQLTKDNLPDGEDRSFVTTVRDQGGALLYRATLTFRGERL